MLVQSVCDNPGFVNKCVSDRRVLLTGPVDQILVAEIPGRCRLKNDSSVCLSVQMSLCEAKALLLKTKLHY